jgi:glycosyltransferase involved in cell wall biosynthesis
VKSDPQFLADFGINAALPLIGTVTALRPEKNIRRLIDAFALVLDKLSAQLVIVGDGPERPNLVAYAAERRLSNHVVFTGQVFEPEKFFSAFKVYALSSDTEQMPLSVLEAMAAGLPLAATDVGDVRYMLAEENHRFLVRREANDLALAILMLLEDPARAIETGSANARRVAASFGEDRMRAAYQGLFDGEWSHGCKPSPRRRWVQVPTVSLRRPRGDLERMTK